MMTEENESGILQGNATTSLKLEEEFATKKKKNHLNHYKKLHRKIRRLVIPFVKQR